MLQRNGFNNIFILIILLSLLSPVLSDIESGFSQGCYSACPRKILTLQNASRQQADKEWIQCLKQCHQINSWKFIIIISAIVLFIAIVCILIYICWGQRIRLKYTFHVERKKRSSITTQDQTKILIFEQASRKFKQIMTVHFREYCIEFENDSGHKKKFLIDDAIFHERKNNVMENMFSIILIRKKQQIQVQPQNPTQLQQQSQNEINNNTNIEEQQYSQLIGAISLTNKGLNLWWLKIDEKPEDPNGRCRLCSRKNKKYFAVYQKDPFAPEGSFIGNVVLEDSSKSAQQRYTKYVIKRKQAFEIIHFQERVIQT